ncbi:MAG: hypothetical protein GY715_18070, partial [Planctomycetes bacterium]|nr:hypothetical protein [Planctomycetota bacterium]
MLLQDPIANLQATSRRRKNRTKYVYDDLNRRIAVVENHDTGHPVELVWLGAPADRWGVADPGTVLSDDANRVTSFVYDGNSNIVKQVAHLPGDGGGGGGEDVQVTEYRYRVDQDAIDNPLVSELSSHGLLGAVVYPDEGVTGGATEDERTVYYAYNRQGELIAMRDQSGTRHDYARDVLGRVETDHVAAWGADIDQAIDEIATTYDALGRVRAVTSRGQGQPANGVHFDYNGLWQIISVDQDVNGAPEVVENLQTGQWELDPAGDTQRVAYAYAQDAFPGGNHSRLTSLTYPDDVGGHSEVAYGYGAPATNDRISRPDSLSFDLGARKALYDHIGMGMFATVEYDDDPGQSVMTLTRHAAHNGARTPGVYPGLDRFGRVVRQMWVDEDFDEHDPPHPNVPNIPPAVELTYSYDASSNRTSADDGRPGARRVNRDFRYGYDGLDRLVTAERGYEDGVGSFHHVPSTNAYTASQAFGLDVLGNWDELVTDTDGNGPVSGVPDATETRSHNGVNELLGQDDLEHTFDHAGNMRVRQQSSLMGSSTVDVTYTHDA